MRFFLQYFTKHHLIHAPHKWFLALLLSPIHLAEVRYQNVYHLNFRHARKLFIFDITLLLSAFALLGASLYWFFYDPTITDLVNIQITPTTHLTEQGTSRIRSGDMVDFTITYTNKSDVALEQPKLRVELPAGFIPTTADPKTAYDTNTRTFTLPEVPAQNTASVMIGGLFFGEPDKEEAVTALLSYEQPDSDLREQKRTGAIITLRGSTIVTTADIPDTILAKGTFPIRITVKNTSETDATKDILIPKKIKEGLAIQVPNTTLEDTDDGWRIPVLLPNESATLDGLLVIDIQDAGDNTELSFAVLVAVQDHLFPQAPDRHTVTILRPEMSVKSAWTDGNTKVIPGESKDLTITLTNTGNAAFEHLSVSFPLLSSIIDSTRVRQLNNGRLSGSSVVIGEQQLPALHGLAPGASISFPLHIPFRSTPEGGTDLKLSIPVHIQSNVTGVPDATYDAQTESGEVAVGTSIRLNADLRYYTAEGDQLGRGPIPPEVGKETKYWVSAIISNGTSRASNISLSAILAPGIVPTGKSSVSLGNDVSYNPGTRTMSWSHASLGAHQSAGIYFEVSFTPTESQRGKTPIIIEGMTVTGYDSYVGNALTASAKALDTSLPNDPIGRKKGTMVR